MLTVYLRIDYLGLILQPRLLGGYGAGTLLPCLAEFHTLAFHMLQASQPVNPYPFLPS